MSSTNDFFVFSFFDVIMCMCMCMAWHVYSEVRFFQRFSFHLKLAREYDEKKR